MSVVIYPNKYFGHAAAHKWEIYAHWRTSFSMRGNSVSPEAIAGAVAKGKLGLLNNEKDAKVMLTCPLIILSPSQPSFKIAEQGATIAADQSHAL